MNIVFAAFHDLRNFTLPHVFSVIICSVLSITSFTAYSLEAYAASSRPASVCFKLREAIDDLVDRVAAGDYNVSSDRLAAKPFSEVDERDVVGEWSVTDGSGSEFVIFLEPSFNFSCRRKDRSDIQLSGLYYFGRNNRTGQIALRFELRQVHAEGRARTLFPAPPTYTSIIERIALHQMVAPALHVQRSQSGFAYGLTSAPVTWKRGGDHAVCADLRRLKAEYDEGAHGRLQKFKKTEKDTLEALWRIANSIEKSKSVIDKNLKRHLRKTALGFVRVMANPPSYYFYLLSVRYRERRLLDKNADLKKLIDEEWALISEYNVEREGADQCAAFLSDYSYLNKGLLCD